MSAHMPAFGRSLTEIAERWWERRYRDLIRPGSPQYLETYLRLADAGQFPAAAPALAGFAARLEAAGLPAQLAFASYYEQPARYGHGEAMTAAENVFAADTAAAMAQIIMAAAASLPAQALAAASMAQ